MKLTRLASCTATFLAAALLAPSASTADDWPFFRGARADGISLETEWVAEFGEDDAPIAWRRNVGIGVMLQSELEFLLN